MIKYIVRRLLSLIPLLLGISILVFLLMYLTPGDFLSQARSSKDISPEVVRQQEIKLGLDKPWYTQYAMWLNCVSPVKTSLLDADDATGDDGQKHSLVYFGKSDFGYSWSYKISVSQLIGQRLFATLILALSTLFLTYLVGIPLGVMAAVKKNSIFDKISAFLAYASLSLPSFFLALLAVLFAATTGLFPTGGQTSVMYEFLSPLEKFGDYLSHLILPTLVLSIGSIASLMRIMRANFLEYMQSGFAATARAKGLSENVVMFRHVLRNALNPIITSFGFSLSGLLSGALLVENVMNYPGLGQLIYTAILKQDQYVVMAGVVISCVMLVLGQLLADILLAASDPRIRLENTPIPFKKSIFAISCALLIVMGLTSISVFAPAFFEILKIAGLWIFKIFMVVAIALLVFALLFALYYFVRYFLKKILKSRKVSAAFFVLCAMYFGAIFADFLAPYDMAQQNLNCPYHPPTKIFFEGGTLRAQVYELADKSISQYKAVEGKSREIKFFVKKDGAKLFGFLPINHALFGVDASSEKDARIYLLGSDSSGRDIFSRLLYGAQVSLSIGFVGIAITMVLGFLVGGLSGYFGGTFDFFAMRFVEFLMAVPALYLLLAMRSALAPHFDSSQMYFMIVVILSFLGWAGAARVIRGMSLSLAKRQFVQAAVATGQSPLKIILKHFLPNVMGFLIVSATLSIPSYILGEAALSFLGLGIQEPSASWGLMLSQAQSDIKILMLGFWWMLLPGLAIFLTVLCFNAVGEYLNEK